MRHPWWRTKRSWPLFSPTFFFFLVQACLRAPHVVADEAKLAIVFTYFFLVQASRRAPLGVADEAKLAIVFTYFFSSFFLRLLLSTHFGDTQEANFFLALIFWHN